MNESMKILYPGAGYSGSMMTCHFQGQNFNLGIYVGGFKSSRTWVTLLFNDERLSWILKNV